MTFINEADFETQLLKMLSNYGWDKEILHNYTEKQLIDNWANILFENNRSIDRLNDYPLTEGEMKQIMEQIKSLGTPLKLNGFINGGTITITRDNEKDKLHFGKEISLKIYDRKEIAAGQSRYQIVEQPSFSAKSKMLNDRKGDFTLLINGMPVIHVELKRSGIPISQACWQIENYSHEGVFTGLFSLIQIFVAMTPEETVYFANPGKDGKFNPDFYFHWADFNNEPINDWKQIASTLLSIPMAHEMIGFYTVADNSDGILKVMRSYQYYAANAISDKVSKTKWENDSQHGGYIWHTTGSGKTMTSFKSAQLISESKDADKVIFLMDRIELGTQSLMEYRSFAEEQQEVQSTENTQVLLTKLKSDDPANILIVTSIQKMSNIKDENALNASDIEKINAKRIVFIVDECHRSTFGDMLMTIKNTFPKAIFFGFTGTPIQNENQKKHSTTSTVFGDELHRYSIADGIRDKNVLGFDPNKICTYKDRDLRISVACDKAKVSKPEEAISDPQKSEIFYKYINLPMAGYYNDAHVFIKGIEDYLPKNQYETKTHREMVVQDIVEQWNILSHYGKFHAIFATGSIIEAIEYYSLLKSKAPKLKITALFDQNIDNLGTGIFKEEGLIKIIDDYNQQYGQDYTIPTFHKMKKDISARLAHKKQYERIEMSPEKQIDLVIVVDQMLTGFDSKWINTLYLDKVLKYENIIQAFSRTNRLFGPDKPFGTIRYYRKPHTMEQNIKAAVKLYSGDKPLGLFVDRLNKNIANINSIYMQIKDLFEQSNIQNFEHLPSETIERKKFAKLFKSLNEHLEAAKIQGFRWDKSLYENKDKAKGEVYKINVLIDENTYLILALRYKELFGDKQDGGNVDLPYEIEGYLTEIDTDDINVEYMNSRFVKYLKALNTDGINSEKFKQIEEELHKTFATLPQEEQKYANIFLHDIQRGDVKPQEGKTLRDYITEYLVKAKNDRIHKVALVFGLDEDKLRDFMKLNITEANINEFGRFDNLKATVDKQKAKEYFEKIEGKKIILPKVNIKIDQFLRNFILSGGFDIEIPE